MKKPILFFLLFVLALSSCPFALAETTSAPVSGSLVLSITDGVENVNAFTAESYPGVYLTPYDTEKIIKGESKRNKPIFLHFMPPEGALPVSFGPARIVFTNTNAGVSYYYYVKSRARFGTYLNGVKDEFIIANGKDEIAAIYLGNEDHRAYALVSLPGKEFSELGRIDIAIADHTGQRSREDLIELIEAEVSRLLIDMHFVELDRYWSDGTYASVELQAEEDPVRAIVDTTGLVIMGVDSTSSLRYKMRNDDGKVREVNVKLSPYSYAHVDHGAKYPSSEHTLSDGTKGRVITYKGVSYAGFPLLDIANYGGGPLYLTFAMEVSSESDFLPLLEEAYARLTLAL